MKATGWILAIGIIGWLAFEGNQNYNQQATEASQKVELKSEQTENKKDITINNETENSTVNKIIEKVSNVVLKSSEPQKGYLLNHKEKQFLEMKLTELENKIADGSIDQNYFFTNFLKFTTSDQIYHDYDDNQVNADNKYYEKDIYIKGKITRILSGINNEPYITTDADNSFLEPQLHFDDKYRNQVADLKKGHNIYAVCKGGGAIAGTPMLTDCILSKDYAPMWRSLVKEKINDFLAGGRPSFFKNDDYIKLFSLIVAGDYIPDNSIIFNVESCKIPSNFKKCKSTKKDMDEAGDKMNNDIYEANNIQLNYFDMAQTDDIKKNKLIKVTLELLINNVAIDEITPKFKKIKNEINKLSPEQLTTFKTKLGL